MAPGETRDPSIREAAANPARNLRDPSIAHFPYGNYLVLLRKLDEAYEKQGLLDPLTWLEVRDQIEKDPDLHVGQRLILTNHIANRLRLAGGGWR